jgi:chemotaxis protein methyltransferase WspC
MDPYEELARHAGLVLDQLGRKAIGRVDLASPTALEQAAEILAVPETWFFRDGEPFVCLARFAAHGPRPLRVLSVPCATGEEPYSIAIALLEAGLAPGEFTIDAVDISAHAIAVARCAVYGKSSFRHPMPGLIEKHFDPVEQGYRLHDEVAAQVRFRQANLLEGLAPALPYHAIYCRNLLIYLHQEARQKVVAILRGLLAADGVLFAGHSEITLFLEAGFRKVEHPRSFACRAVAATSPLEGRSLRSREAMGWQGKAPGPPRRKPLPTKVGQAISPAGARIRDTTVPPAPALDDARRLADQGRLAEAAALCTRLSPTADVFFLQGLISQSSGHCADAEEFFRRALYLDPGHLESMVHMSLLCASRGDSERSTVFRDRALRLREASSTTEAP